MVGRTILSAVVMECFPFGVNGGEEAKGAVEGIGVGQEGIVMKEIVAGISWSWWAGEWLSVRFEQGVMRENPRLPRWSKVKGRRQNVFLI
jgi:hypothetical protein